MSAYRLLLLAACLSSLAWTQEFRATILGQILDPSGAPVPGVAVKATKEDTNVSRETVSNASGLYTLVGLEPGRYTVTVTANGFSTVRRTGIVLQVAEKLNLPVRLEVGQVTEAITVVGEQELIQTATASRGIVFDPVKMQEIPLNGRQAFMLMRLSPGVMFTQRQFGSSGFSGTRAWDVNGSFSMNGGRTGTNQFLLNGAPISTQGTFNLSPNVEAVQEMKIMVNTYDSQYGRSGGGHVNTTLKSGSNNWHGSVFDFWRNRILDANTRQNNAGGQPRGFRNHHQYGGVIGGPIRKDKDFVFFSFEGWQERTPFPSVATVPPVEIRGGNFNFTPAGQSGPIRVYDQLTSRDCTLPGAGCITGGIFIRQPFPGNIIPASRISPVARNILALYPAPNFNPQSLQQNFLRPDNTGRYRYEQPMGRWDHIIGSNDRLNMVFTFQDGSEFRNSNGFDPPAQTGNMPGTVRRDLNFILSYDRTISPTKILHLQASYNRFIQNFPNVSDPAFTWDKLGVKQIPEVPTFPTRLAPQVAVSGYNTILGSQFLNESSRQQLNFQASVAQTTGRHSLKYGFEWAQLIHHNRASGNASGAWTFDTVWSRQHFGRRQPSPLDGNGVADLMLGLMNSGNIPFNDTTLRREPYLAGFIQDDWKLSPTLTLNLGLRYDIQFPMYEIHDRLVSGFDFTTVNPVSSDAVAAWRSLAARTPNYPAAPDAIRGGLLYANIGNQPRRIYSYDLTNIQPRIGVAYNFLPKTVMRGGFGIFHRTLLGSATTTGFSQSTAYINSVNGGLTHRAGATGPHSLENPFPDGLVPPLGASAGLLTSLGTGVSFQARNRPIPRTFQWSYTIERELPWDMVIEVSYVGSFTNKENIAIQLSDASQRDWEIAATNTNHFQQRIPNPWFGIAPTNTGLGAGRETTRRDLLRRIPQHTSVSQSGNPWGHAWYHGLQFRFEKRMLNERSRGGALTWVTAYTWSKIMERSLRQDFTFEWMPFISQVASQDRSHNFTHALIWDLPIGKGRAFLPDLAGAGQALLGGWTFNATLIYQSGVPLGTWNRWEYTCGDPLKGERTETRWFDNSRNCYRQLGPFELTQMPARFHQIRSHTAPQLDLMLSKRFNFTERYQLEFRGEAFNATNTPLRGDPPSGDPSNAQFGILPVQQLNFSRNVQLGLRLRF
ncbi:MAG: TonB-dependent receptor [Acidimicrobiia bacterium]|nr:TonB-dependent receptor [Acidimicrobiia bacterium]